MAQNLLSGCEASCNSLDLTVSLTVLMGMSANEETNLVRDCVLEDRRVRLVAKSGCFAIIAKGVGISTFLRCRLVEKGAKEARGQMEEKEGSSVFYYKGTSLRPVLETSGTSRSLGWVDEPRMPIDGLPMHQSFRLPRHGFRHVAESGMSETFLVFTIVFTVVSLRSASHNILSNRSLGRQSMGSNAAGDLAHKTMKHAGNCSCGLVQVELLTDPVMNYFCHCSHCRKFASEYEKEPRSYLAACAVWRWTVNVQGTVEYTPSVGAWGLFSLKRGRCVQCKDPVWERGGRLAYPFRMVAAQPLGLEPDVNLYYDSGFKDGPTHVRTIQSDWGSLLYEIWLIVTVGIPRLPWSLGAAIRNKLSRKDKAQ